VAETTPSSTKSKRKVAGLLPTGTDSPEYCRATKHMPGVPNAMEGQLTVPASCGILKVRMVEMVAMVMKKFRMVL
jgi:hypothetical protein